MEAIQRKDYLETVRVQCHAITFMMERNPPATKPQEERLRRRVEQRTR